jgi:hypothetical protein
VWSSYPSYAGLRVPLDYVTDVPVLAMMDRRKKKQRLIYRRFVESGIIDIDAAFIVAKERSPYCIGSENYLDEVAAEQKQRAQGYSQREDLYFQKTEVLYSAEEVLKLVAEALAVETDELCRRQRNSWLRPLCSRALQLYSGLTHREIARTLSIGSGAAVSKQLRLLNNALAEDRQVQAHWQAIKRGVEQ